MSGMFWLAIGAFALAAVGIVWFSVQRWTRRKAAEEDRLAAFIANTTGKSRLVEAAPAVPAPAVPAAAAPDTGLAQQKLLFEAAHKAGEAGEPALAIQLYARLLARFPASSFADQARARVEAEKKKLGKA